MLKWSFTFLLLANLAFFALLRWGHNSPTDGENANTPTALNAEKIVLLAPENTPVSAPVAASATSATLAASAPASAASYVSPASLVAATPNLSAPVCLELNTSTIASAQRIEQQISIWHWGDKVQQHVTESGSNSYWVYIGPLHSRAEVEQKILQLKARNVLDFFALTEPGVWQNAISLGVFKTEEAAKKHLLKLQNQGVKTAVIGEKMGKVKQSQYIFKALDPDQAGKVSALQKTVADSELKNLSCNAN